MILDSRSLVNTVNNINDKYLVGDDIPYPECLELSRWIAARQGGKGSYRGSFAPTPYDFEQGIRTFTGERLLAASARHIMGQEAARALWLMGCDDPAIREAYSRATTWMHDDQSFPRLGTYCCGRCSLAFWRHYWIGDFDHKEERLVMGLKIMESLRLGDGNWRTFPFYYAVYTLQGIDLKAARAELKYARPAMERYVKNARPGPYTQRRTLIIEKALQEVS